ncbi:hypothetical protein IE81DRAFT_344550 [Ceraceosorus guamensis]|uniref:Uncharacterized protein n=1 Tax=Ceraceosorus guamensis TaxID=1522189 RepID=A0A316WCQ9_9BASI|nr:hypothetical protein IE81DRAFT_344550 [Ceraceosorus guamensis]PWN45653.1 hypothetical protein IE81DRAFT_344550 [Ceraceosorus guamensis]
MTAHSFASGKVEMHLDSLPRRAEDLTESSSRPSADLSGTLLLSKDEPPAQLAETGAAIGSSTTVFFDQCHAMGPARSDGELSRRSADRALPIIVAGSPLAKLVCYDCEGLNLTLRSRLLTSSAEIFRCSNLTLTVDVTRPIEDESAADVHHLPRSMHAAQAGMALPWRLGALQLDPPLENVTIVFQDAGMCGEVILTSSGANAHPHEASADHAPSRQAASSDDTSAAEPHCDLRLAGFKNVTILVRAPQTAEGSRLGNDARCLAFRIDEPLTRPPSSSEEVQAVQTVTSAQADQYHLRLVSVHDQRFDGWPSWSCEALQRAAGTRGYVSLGDNPPRAARRRSIDSGVGL